MYVKPPPVGKKTPSWSVMFYPQFLKSEQPVGLLRMTVYKEPQRGDIGLCASAWLCVVLVVVHPPMKFQEWNETRPGQLT